MTTPENHLQACTLYQLSSLHNAVTHIMRTVSGEFFIPPNNKGPAFEVLDDLYHELSRKQCLIEKEIDRRRITNYEDAILVFNARTYCVEEAEGHYEEVLRLLAHVKAEAA